MEPKKRNLQIFVAPNGARNSKRYHPEIPITIEEIVTTAKACFGAGATGLHAHVRDETGKHILDAGLYGELLSEMALLVPQMEVQITTESVGQYSPAEQRALVMAVKPKLVSVSMTEMFADDDLAAVSRFYYQAQEEDIGVQHIVYTPEEFLKLAKMTQLGTLPAKSKSVLFVLGRHTKGQQSSAEMLNAYKEVLNMLRLAKSWQVMVCAFGLGETDCLVAAAKANFDCRVGFENNIFHADGRVAEDNSVRVLGLVSALKTHKLFV